ncbi:hypothetical protein [Vibrio owensii]|uniref:hypothetical protein n=1 Tax=Vibrio harveyi group TaxID=717610 RepID=UPI003CC62A5E
MAELQYYGFTDCRARGEYQTSGELNEYVPSGVILTINYDMPPEEKIDFVVMYCSPRGARYRETRGKGDIKIHKIQEEEWKQLKAIIESTKLE